MRTGEQQFDICLQIKKLGTKHRLPKEAARLRVQSSWIYSSTYSSTGLVIAPEHTGLYYDNIPGFCKKSAALISVSSNRHHVAENDTWHIRLLLLLLLE